MSHIFHRPERCSRSFDDTWRDIVLQQHLLRIHLVYAVFSPCIHASRYMFSILCNGLTLNLALRYNDECLLYLGVWFNCWDGIGVSTSYDCLQPRYDAFDIPHLTFDLLTFVNRHVINAFTKFQNPTMHLSYFN